MFLNEAELKYLTGLPKSRHDERCKHLAQLGVPYSVNVRGELVVTRKAVEERHRLPSATELIGTPHWGALV